MVGDSRQIGIRKPIAEELAELQAAGITVSQ